MRRAKTETIITALHILADEIHSDDGVANAAIREAADRLEELRATSEKRCVWTLRADYEYKGTCGIEWSFGVGGRAENSFQFCPHCGGRTKLAKRPK